MILGMLLDRRPHVEASAVVWAAVENGGPGGVMAAHSATAIHYLIRKDLGNLKATRVVAGMAGIFEIAAVNRIVN
ncbi:MAG TPA: hypothetical protein VHZ74_04780 [Bryobacteraceae bacterium]|nr:hypothetical protein [Bryobacteraceae bacterium]